MSNLYVKAYEAQLEREKRIKQRALTLAVVCVQQRVEALRAEWRGLSEREQSRRPGLQDQLDEEREALRMLEKLRSEAYTDA